jgi:hypothetical protein
MARHSNSAFRQLIVAFVCLAAAPAAPAHAEEIWVAPTYQQDLGGLGIGSNVVWPATVIGAARLAWGVPRDLFAFLGAKVVIIPHSPGGAANLNVLVCAADSGNAVTSNCAGPFTQAFTGVPNQLTEVEIGGLVSSKIGTAGATYMTVLVYSTPTTTTDHIVGLRFSYTPKVPEGVASLGANTFTDSQTVQIASGSAAVLGVHTGTSGATYGVEGRADGGNGVGVYGLSTATSGGASYGVYGDASQNNLSGTGVFGVGTSYGVYGQSTRTASSGVFGRSLGTSSLTYGVYGDATANTIAAGIGVFGTANGFGLYGSTISTAANTAGVWGDANVGGGIVYGVGGQTNSITSGAAGVIGKANGGTGTTYGVQGATASNTTDAAAVRGDANAGTGSIFGGYFRSASNGGTGVLGWAPAGTGSTYGVRGESDSIAGVGVYGITPNGNGTNRTFGVRGQSNDNSGTGVAGFAPNGGSIATPSLGIPVGVLGSALNGGFGVYSIGNTKLDGDVYVTGFASVGGPVVADSVVLGGVYFASVLPACGPVNTRENEGKMILTAGGAGQDAHLFVCIERADNSFAWRQVF